MYYNNGINNDGSDLAAKNKKNQTILWSILGVAAVTAVAFGAFALGQNTQKATNNSSSSSSKSSISSSSMVSSSSSVSSTNSVNSSSAVVVSSSSSSAASVGIVKTFTDSTMPGFSFQYDESTWSVEKTGGSSKVDIVLTNKKDNSKLTYSIKGTLGTQPSAMQEYLDLGSGWKRIKVGDSENRVYALTVDDASKMYNPLTFVEKNTSFPAPASPAIEIIYSNIVDKSMADSVVVTTKGLK